MLPFFRGRKRIKSREQRLALLVELGTYLGDKSLLPDEVRVEFYKDKPQRLFYRVPVGEEMMEHVILPWADEKMTPSGFRITYKKVHEDAMELMVGLTPDIRNIVNSNGRMVYRHPLPTFVTHMNRYLRRREYNSENWFPYA